MAEASCMRFTGTKEQEKELRTVIKEHKDVEGALIPILHKAQKIYGYLPLEILKIIADETGESLSKIYGVVTFYSQFSLKPKGEYKIAVCLGTACYVKGAGEIIERIKTKVGIPVDGISEDGKFSLDATRCIGACGLAPVLTVNDDVYGKVTLDDIKGILKKYKK